MECWEHLDVDLSGIYGSGVVRVSLVCDRMDSHPIRGEHRARVPYPTIGGPRRTPVVAVVTWWVDDD